MRRMYSPSQIERLKAKYYHHYIEGIDEDNYLRFAFDYYSTDGTKATDLYDLGVKILKLGGNLSATGNYYDGTNHWCVFSIEGSGSGITVEGFSAEHEFQKIKFGVKASCSFTDFVAEI